MRSSEDSNLGNMLDCIACNCRTLQSNLCAPGDKPSLIFLIGVFKDFQLVFHKIILL